jgi:hypothetical protein
MEQAIKWTRPSRVDDPQFGKFHLSGTGNPDPPVLVNMVNATLRPTHKYFTIYVDILQNSDLLVIALPPLEIRIKKKKERNTQRHSGAAKIHKPNKMK